MAVSTTSSVAFGELEQLVGQMKSTIQSAFESGTPVDQVEQEIFGQLLALGNSLLGSLFDAMHEGDVGPTVEKNGKRFRRLPEKSHRTYYSIFGKFDLNRYTYGTRSGQKHQAVPFDEHLGLPDHPFSLLLESWLGQLETGESFHEACEKLALILRLKIHVDSAERIVERLGKVGASVLEAPPPIDPESEGEILVQTSDNKGVVMRNEFPQEAPLPVGSPAPTCGPKPNRKRMACVAGVYSIDRNPRTPMQVLDLLFHTKEAAPLEGIAPRPRNPRYFARLNQFNPEGQQIGKSAEEQAQLWMTVSMFKRRKAGQPLVVLHDGQPSLWELERKYQLGWNQIEILDLLHVIPRIWDAAKILHPDSIEPFVKERLLVILSGGIGMVLMGLRRMTSTHDLTKSDRGTMETIINFLESNRTRMDYGRYLAEGLPIATGFIEGACRHVVKDRLERTGMRWTRRGAQSMLVLRCIEASKLWEPLVQKYRSETLNYHGGRKNYYSDLCTAA